MEDQNPEKFLFHLTVEEYVSLLKATINITLPAMIRKEIEAIPKLPIIEENDTIALEEAAKITGLRPKSIYSKVSRLELPSITRNRPLLFSRKELSEWLRNGRPAVAVMMLKNYKKN